MDDAPDTPALTPGLKFLKALVILLMVTMIGGVITITAVLVTRMPDGNTIPLPENLTLPKGAVAQSVTLGPDYIVITTADARILVFNRDGTFRKELPLN